MGICYPDISAKIDDTSPRRLPSLFLAVLLLGAGTWAFIWVAFAMLVATALIAHEPEVWLAFGITFVFTLPLYGYRWRMARLIRSGYRTDGIHLGHGAYSTARAEKDLNGEKYFTRLVPVEYTDEAGHRHETIASTRTPFVEHEQRRVTVLYDPQRPTEALAIFHGAHRDLLWLDDDGVLHLHGTPISLAPFILFVTVLCAGLIFRLVMYVVTA